MSCRKINFRIFFFLISLSQLGQEQSFWRNQRASLIGRGNSEAVTRNPLVFLSFCTSLWHGAGSQVGCSVFPGLAASTDHGVGLTCSVYHTREAVSRWQHTSPLGWGAAWGGGRDVQVSCVLLPATSPGSCDPSTAWIKLLQCELHKHRLI